MYAELLCKTNFSFLEGASHSEELVKRAHEIGLQSLALTDRNGVYGLPKAYWYAKDIPGFHLITGAEITMHDSSPLTLLARDRGGYAMLCRLLTQAHADKPKGEAVLRLNELQETLRDSRSRGLYAIARDGSQIQDYSEIFEDRLSLALSRQLDGRDDERLLRALKIHRETGVPLLASNDVLFHEKKRSPVQDVLTCIKNGKTLVNAGFELKSNHERYLKSELEMRRLFHDLPQAIERSVELAQGCTFSLSELKYRYPSEWIPAGFSAQTYLIDLVWRGAKSRFPNGVPEKARKQIEHELSLIERLGYADYFLTIEDIVSFARQRKILCQGRGSAANSIVCFVLGITAVNPIQMNFLFERFISLERKEPPDIDVDFEHERREEVIQYIYGKYGRDRAAMVSAVVTYQDRSLFREVAKTFGVEVGTLSSRETQARFEELSRSSPVPEVREKIEAITDEMERFPRHLSIHSGGFTLSADPIIEIVPVEPARMEGRTIIQWDKNDLDYLGLLKVDVLALGMLSALNRTLLAVGKELYELPPEDPETYKMISRADTVGTFQVESRAQMNMSGRLRPENFYDLVIQIAIVRPGPIVGKMVHPYLKRKHGLEKAVYPNEILERILGKTLGVPLFQEQIMKIAIELGGFSPGEADLLRRAIGAWRSSGSIREVGMKLFDALLKNGVPEDYAQMIFEQMKGFAHYGFPESHAASFALLAYASCYLKRYHHAEFTYGLLNSLPMGFYAAHTLIDDAKSHGVTVHPCDPNLSSYETTLENGALRLGLKLIQGISENEIKTLIAGRPYHSLADFLSRNPIRADILERLAMGNFFAAFGLNERDALWRILADAIPKTVRAEKTQLDLFQVSANPGDSVRFHSLPTFDGITNDYAAYHASARGHPMVELRRIKKIPQTRIQEIKRLAHNTPISVSGLLLVRQRPPTAGGVTFGAIEDETGILDLTLFQDVYAKYKPIFLTNCFLIIRGTLQKDGDAVNVLVRSIAPVFSERDPETLSISVSQYFW